MVFNVWLFACVGFNKRGCAVLDGLFCFGFFLVWRLELSVVKIKSSCSMVELSVGLI
jgi:hypothetical protein